MQIQHPGAGVVMGGDRSDHGREGLLSCMGKQERLDGAEAARMNTERHKQELSR